MVNLWKIPLYCLVALCFRDEATGTTLSSRAGWVGRALCSSIRQYSDAGGKISELTPSVLFQALDPLKANSYAEGNFLDRVVILTAKQPNNPQTGEVIVALTAHRILEDVRDTPGRYVVWMKDREFSYRWESEADVAAYFASVGLELPFRGVWEQERRPEYLKMNLDAPPAPSTNQSSQEKLKHNQISEHKTPSPIGQENRPYDNTFGRISPLVIGLTCIFLALLVWTITKVIKKR